MADENWQRVRKIFDDALRQKPEERQKFVRRACGKNKTLRVEVESLLESLDSADSFMEKPAIARISEQILTENRQFSKGQFLGHYEIIGQIGAGGMGEVYLAQDTKLNRRVALKILHENLLSDNHANRRLLREAQAAALLEHPNICAIYDISETDDCNFIVMQYVEGKTLAERLAEKRPATKESLELAIQISDALAEAHARGIIHRDIKPANIIVNEKKQVKVLDFGLAKIIEDDGKIETEKGLYSSGAVMGTVPYMSPEQLCGKRLDARTDIFSFGALFYEILTGRQAFAGESNAERISAILNDQPDLAEIPETLQPIVRKCLKKDSRERYQTARILMSDLLEVKIEGGLLKDFSPSKPKTLPTVPFKLNSSAEKLLAVPKSPRFYFWKSTEQNISNAPETVRLGYEKNAETRTAGRKFSAIMFAALAVFIVAGAGIIFFWQYNETDDSVFFDELRPVVLVSWKAAAGAYYSDYRVSHNGKLIAYSSSQAGGNESIYVKQTADGEQVRVTKDDWTNVNPIWSPDDQRIAYASIRENQSGIYVCPALGGTAIPLKIIGKGDIFLRHWTRDGTAIFYEYQNNLFRLDLATQEIAQVTDFPSSPGTEKYFSLSPNEERLAFCDKTEGQEEIWTMPVNGGEKQRLTSDGGKKRRPRWHPDGKRILYNVLRGNFQQIGLAYTDGRVPVQITRGDSQYEMIDVSSDGTKIFYFALENRSDISGVKIETGEEFEVVADIEYEYWADISPDGKSIAFQSKTVKQFGRDSIIVKPVGSRAPTLKLEGYNPRWLSDSRHISFTRWSETEQAHQLWLVNTANGEEKLLTKFGVMTPSRGNLPSTRGEIGVVDFSPDGGNLVYLNQKSPKNVWLSSLETEEAVNLTNNDNPNVRYYSPLFSADGRRLIFVSSEKIKENMVFSVWLAEHGSARQIYSSPDGLRLLGWAPSGKQIYLETTEGLLKAIPQNVRFLQVSLSGESRTLNIFKNIYADTMTLSPDGKTVAFTARQNDKDDIWTAAVWSGEKKKITTNDTAQLYYASPAWASDGKTIYFDKQEQIDTISMFENFR